MLRNWLTLAALLNLSRKKPLIGLHHIFYIAEYEPTSISAIITIGQWPQCMSGGGYGEEM